MNRKTQAEPRKNGKMFVAEHDSERKSAGNVTRQAKELTYACMRESMGAGLIPFPFVDIIAVSNLQLKMLSGLAELYCVKFSENQGRSVIASLNGGIVATLIARGTDGGVIKSLPVSGAFMGSSIPTFAGASTFAIGKAMMMHFDSGGTLLEFEPQKMRNYIYDQFVEGQAVAKNLEENGNSEKRNNVENQAVYTDKLILH